MPMVGRVPMAKMSLFVLFFSASLIIPSDANNFLRASSATHADKREHMNKESVRANLLKASEGALGPNSTARRVKKLEAALSPMFAALPKNRFGNLGQATARYALHRLFVQRHAWYIKGLEPDGGAYNASSPTDALPLTHLQELFEGRLKQHGFSLHDTAVFAATLEQLIHQQAVDLTEQAYELNHFSQDNRLTQFQADKVIEAYMKVYIMGDAAGEVSDEEFDFMYPSWKDTKVFLRDMRQNIVYAEGDHSKSAGAQTFTPALVTRVIEEVAENYGVFQNSECTQMKAELLRHGDHHTGHVPLSSFYQAALEHGSQLFSESKEYLKELGALDESDPDHPHVIVPNYILSKTNCISTLSLHSTCCINECEALLGHLESIIASPEADPNLIAKLVADLPSSTVQASRQLSEPLLFRLDEIARAHGGMVPLHGRLFAQWMHHAYPRECPYPHVSGSKNPQTPDEWIEEKGGRVMTEWEMRQIVDDAKSANGKRSQRSLYWSSEEELLEARAPNTSSAWAWRFMRYAAYFILLVLLACAMCANEHHLTLSKSVQGFHKVYPTLLRHRYAMGIDKHLV